MIHDIWSWVRLLFTGNGILAGSFAEVSQEMHDMVNKTGGVDKLGEWVSGLD